MRAALTFVVFEAQSRGPCTRCLRFAAPVARTPRKTRFRLVANLCRVGSGYPPGSDTRFQVVTSFHPPRHGLPVAPRLDISDWGHSSKTLVALGTSGNPFEDGASLSVIQMFRNVVPGGWIPGFVRGSSFSATVRDPHN